MELESQNTLSFLALEAREHAEALEEILAYGREARMYWTAGCSVAEIRSLMNGTAEVN